VALMSGSCTAPTSSSTGTSIRSIAADGTARAAMPDIVAARPYEVVHEQRTFVDPSRPTREGKQSPAQPDRTLVTELYHPDAQGPFPTIVFAHGSNGHPDKFTHLLSAWAAAGYVVAAPAFPLTNNTVPAAAANNPDLWNQPDDVSFVLDQMLAASAAVDDPLAGKVDSSRLGAAGLSLGGATTYGVVFNDCCRDPRFNSAVVLAGATIPLSQAYDLGRGIPLLIMHGDRDLALPHSMAVEAYGLAIPPKYFVTLVGGSHAEPFEDVDTPYDAIVDRTTIAFWDVYLAGFSDRRSEIETAAVVEGLSTFRSAP
jgi:dienelactone hydrolase